MKRQESVWCVLKKGGRISDVFKARHNAKTWAEDEGYNGINAKIVRGVIEYDDGRSLRGDK